MASYRISVVNTHGDTREFTVAEGHHQIGPNERADLRLPPDLEWSFRVLVSIDSTGCQFAPEDGHNESPEPCPRTDSSQSSTGTFHPFPCQLEVNGFRLRVDRADAAGIPEPRLDALEPGSATSYKVGQKIASGGMGNVFRASESSLGRSVAMKVMRPVDSDSDQARRRFLREAMVLGRLEHPNIVPIHDFGRDPDGRLYYTMKLVRGATLRELLKRIRENDELTLEQFPLARLLDDFRKVCDAVAFAHARGIIHRDLKPENIMIGEFGEVLVMDWGLAKILGEAESDQGDRSIEGFSDFSSSEMIDMSTTLTMAGTIVGTPQFMSPEQAEARHADIDARSDVFGLGGILYSILTLRAPVSGESLSEVVDKVRRGSITPPIRYNENGTETLNLGSSKTDREPPRPIVLNHLPTRRVPAALSAVAMRALSPASADRHPSVEALQADIAAFQSGYATSAENVGGWGQLLLLIRRNRVMASALLVILFLSIIFVIQLAASRDDALRASVRAKTAETLASEGKRNAEVSLLKAQITLAEAALEDGRGEKLLQDLETVPPEIRDLEWAYLRSRADESMLHYPAEPRLREITVAGNEPGKLLTAISDASVVTVSNNGKVTRRLDTGLAPPLLLEVASDGRRCVVASAATGKTLFVDLVAGKKLRTYEPLVAARPPHLQSLKLNPSAEYFATVDSHNRRTTIRATDSGYPLWHREIEGPLAFHPDAESVAVQDSSDLLFLNSRNGTEIRRITPRTDDLHRNTRLAFSPSGDLLAAADRAGVIRVYRTADGTRTARLRVHDVLHDMAFTRNDCLLTMGSPRAPRDRDVQLAAWDLGTGRKIASLLGASTDARRFSFHAASGALLTSGNPVKRWHIPVGMEFRQLRSTINSPRILEFIDDERLLTPYQRIEGAVVDLRNNDVWYPPASASAPKVAISIGKKLVFSGNEGLTFYSANRPYTKFAPIVTAGPPVGLCRSETPDGVLVSFQDGLVEGFFGGTPERSAGFRFPNVSQLSSLLTTHEGFILGVERSTNSTDGGSHLLLMDPKDPSRSVRRRFNRAIRSLCGIADAALLAVAGADPFVTILSLPSLDEQSTFRAHDKPITSLAAHPRTGLIASAGEDLSVKVWDWKKRRIIWRAYGLQQPPSRLAFSPSGKFLAAAEKGGRVRIWSLEELSAH